MRCIDVNVLVNAHCPEAPEHDQYRQWLDEARRDDQPLGVSNVVLSGFLRVVTHPRVFREPTPLAMALTFADGVRAAPACTRVEPGERHWTILTDLCREAEAKGNLVPDAFLAAIAIENNATLVTADRGFRRFSRLRVEHPTDRP